MVGIFWWLGEEKVFTENHTIKSVGAPGRVYICLNTGYCMLFKYKVHV